MAGLMDAIIVPFSAVGISDSVNILLDQGGIIFNIQYFHLTYYVHPLPHRLETH
jgi:hypothetical protein